MCGCEVSQPPFDAIARDRITNRTANDEPDARTAPFPPILGRDIVRSMHGMNDQRGPIRSKPSPSRPSEVSRVVHSQ
jgi:hypothetical protein